MITDIDEAMMTLREVELDVRADFGEDGLEAGYADVVNSVADRCDERTAAELRRRTLGISERF